MSTSANKYDFFESLIFIKGLVIQSLEFDRSSDIMTIYLSHNQKFKTKISRYAKLQNASDSALKNYVLEARATGIHWPELDEDLSLKGFLKDYLTFKIEHEPELMIA